MVVIVEAMLLTSSIIVPLTLLRQCPHLIDYFDLDLFEAMPFT
jgi:hypothetical protein